MTEEKTYTDKTTTESHPGRGRHDDSRGRDVYRGRLGSARDRPQGGARMRRAHACEDAPLWLSHRAGDGVSERDGR